jgi:hypothetical protein
MNRPLPRMSDDEICLLLTMRPGKTPEGRELARAVIARIQIAQAISEAVAS